MNKKQSNESILRMSINQIMEDRFGRYSKYIIQERAIPDVRDGLKPVQRRILFAMNDLKLFHNSSFKKTARVIGEVIGKYHPHGDSSIYEAMVRLAQPWKVNLPLIEIHGNKGSVDGDPPAAMRYTEARLTYFSEKMMKNIYKDTVTFVPNFDDSEREPSILPTMIPNLLINGTSGIAAGYATEMPPHNLYEITTAIIYRLENPNCDFDELKSIVKGPDFPTGGEIEYSSEIEKALKTGKGKIIVRSKYEVIDNKTSSRIIINEIPYGVNKSKLVKSIANIIYSKKIYGLKEVRDESDKEGVRITIYLNNDAKIKSIEKYLLQKTQMQIFYNYNNIAIHKKTPTLMTLTTLIDAYIEHRADVVKRFTTFDLKKAKIKREIIFGLIKVGKNPDQIINAIRNATGSRKGVVSALMNQFNFSEIQANAIADLKLYRLSSTDRREYSIEIKALDLKIKTYEKILNGKKDLNNYLIKDLKILRDQFPEARKTKIINSTLDLTINENALIKDEEIYISISKLGYVKKLSHKVIQSNKIDTFGIKDNDIIIHFSRSTSRKKTLVFTSEGNFVLIPNHKFLDSKWKEIGNHINNYTHLKENARIIGAIDIDDITLPFYVVMITTQGKIKKTKLISFNSKRFSRPLKAFNLKPTDKLLSVALSTGLQNVLIFTKQGVINKYHENKIIPKGIKAGGTNAIKLANLDQILAFTVGKNSEDVLVSFVGGQLAKINIEKIKNNSPKKKGEKYFNISRRSKKVPQSANIFKNKIKVLFIGKTKEVFLRTRINKLKYSLPLQGNVTNLGYKNSINSSILSNNSAHANHKYLIDLENSDGIDNIFDAGEKEIINTQISIDDFLKS